MATTIATTAAVTNMRDSIPSSAPASFPSWPASPLCSVLTRPPLQQCQLSSRRDEGPSKIDERLRLHQLAQSQQIGALPQPASRQPSHHAELLRHQPSHRPRPRVMPHRGRQSCRLRPPPRRYIGPVVLCGLGSELNVPLQKLVDGLGLGAMPPATQCPASPASSALPPAGLDTTSPPPSTPSYSTTDVVNLVSNLLDLCFTINTGSSALSSGSSSDLVADTDNLLAYLLGPNPLRLESASDLGGTLGDILNGGNGALNLGGISGGGDDTAGLNHLVKSLLTALAAKAADPGCGCAGTVAGLVAAVNALGPAVAALSNAVSSCGCRGSPALLSGVSPLLHL
ncbi:hypothetical protein B0H10DRAFT_1186474 [Mycena sp. CBHHK59/15]|nr:hypothetical protein B0H10DRAFT_1186474 [Mycena sp. CBHHK59/15]